MDRRTMLLLAPATVLGTGLAGAAAWLAVDKDQGVGAIGGPFRLVAGDGREVTDAEFRGRLMVIYFGYTSCPDACPTALQDIANAVDMLGKDTWRKVAVLFITLDPERDTPDKVRDYASAFDPAITGLSGTPEQIAAVAKAYRVYYAKHPKAGDDYDVDHSSIIYVMDGRGRFVANFTHETAPEVIAARLRTLLS